MGAILGSQVIMELVKWGSLIGAGFLVYWLIKRSGRKEVVGDINEKRLEDIKDAKEIAKSVDSTPVDDLRDELRKRR